MNILKLKQAEENFLNKYPSGFNHPELAALGKKHKMDKMIALAQECFSKSRFSDLNNIIDNMAKTVSRSSMVSMFEKPKFRDFTQTLSTADTKIVTTGLKNFLHGNQEKGFNILVEALKKDKLAKWSLITIIPNYFYPDTEVFVKPTTAKGVIQFFELTHVEYKPTPTWEFYQKYKQTILEMRAAVDESVAPNNAAFCGFLMMSLDG